jgi:hypothetical protein
VIGLIGAAAPLGAPPLGAHAAGPGVGAAMIFA